MVSSLMPRVAASTSCLGTRTRPRKPPEPRVKRVRPALEGRVRERMNEAFAWETELSSLEPERAVPRKGRGVLDSYSAR